MKKRGPALPVGLAQWSIWGALEADDRLLSERLREGVASPEEMQVAADLIQKKVKPRRLKKGQPPQIVNYAMAQMVLVMEAAGAPRQRKEDHSRSGVETFGVSEKHVYNALAEFGDALVQTSELRAANERAFQQWLDEINARK